MALPLVRPASHDAWLRTTIADMQSAANRMIGIVPDSGYLARALFQKLDGNVDAGFVLQCDHYYKGVLVTGAFLPGVVTVGGTAGDVVVGSLDHEAIRVDAGSPIFFYSTGNPTVACLGQLIYQIARV